MMHETIVIHAYGEISSIIRKDIIIGVTNYPEARGFILVHTTSGNIKVFVGTDVKTQDVIAQIVSDMGWC